MTTTVHPVAKISIRPVDWFTGARRTRRTWQAVLVMRDATERPCGHEAHPTTEYAARCGRKLAARALAEATS